MSRKKWADEDKHKAHALYLSGCNLKKICDAIGITRHTARAWLSDIRTHSPHNQWTEEEDTALSLIYPKSTKEDIEIQLSRRTWEAPRRCVAG